MVMPPDPLARFRPAERPRLQRWHKTPGPATGDIELRPEFPDDYRPLGVQCRLNIAQFSNPISKPPSRQGGQRAIF